MEEKGKMSWGRALKIVPNTTEVTACPAHHCSACEGAQCWRTKALRRRMP